MLAEPHFHDLMYFFWTPDGEPTVDLLYHEAGIPPIHTDKEALRALPDAITSQMSLVHIADGDVPRGFAPEQATPLRDPGSPAADAPLAAARAARDDAARGLSVRHAVHTLETLLHDAEIVTHFPDEVIIRQWAGRPRGAHALPDHRRRTGERA